MRERGEGGRGPASGGRRAMSCETLEKEEWETRLRVAGDQTLCVGVGWREWKLKTRSFGG